MLRSGRLSTSTRMQLSGPAHTNPIGLLTLCYPHLSIKKKFPIALAHRVLLCHTLAATVFLAVHHIWCRAAPPSSATLHPAPRLLQLAARYALVAAHRSPSPVHAGVLLRCRRGATDATAPHQKVMATVDAMAERCATSARRYCDKSACCKRMFQVFRMFQKYVAIVSYGCCKSRSQILHMLQVFQRYVGSV
jgi:hypothetical protein